MKPEAIVHHAPSHCLNCGAAASGNFCPQCGQETRLHVASAREFLHEFIGHYVALEGKLWKTLKLLLFKPGRLTREYIDGRRVRYVQPLRLYLTFSILFFALYKFSGHDVAQVDNEQKARAAAVQPAHKDHDKIRVKVEDEEFDLFGKDGKLRAAAVSINPKLGDKVDKFSALSGDEQSQQLRSAFFGYAPYAVFALMPVFAALLKLLYFRSGRRYGEHLLFALHANAFAFVMLGLLLVMPPIPYLRPALVLWLVFYLPTAMRRVYGGSRTVTAVRWLVLMLLHLLCLASAVLGALALAVVA